MLLSIITLIMIINGNNTLKKLTPIIFTQERMRKKILYIMLYFHYKPGLGYINVNF